MQWMKQMICDIQGKRVICNPPLSLEVLLHDYLSVGQDVKRSAALPMYLILIEQVLSTIGDPASIVLDAKCMLRPLCGCKARVLDQPCSQCVGQVLHHIALYFSYDRLYMKAFLATTSNADPHLVLRSIRAASCMRAMCQTSRPHLVGCSG